jgi:hypothetical protein
MAVRAASEADDNAKAGGALITGEPQPVSHSTGSPTGEGGITGNPLATVRSWIIRLPDTCTRTRAIAPALYIAAETIGRAGSS